MKLLSNLFMLLALAKLSVAQVDDEQIGALEKSVTESNVEKQADVDKVSLPEEEKAAESTIEAIEKAADEEDIALERTVDVDNDTDNKSGNNEQKSAGDDISKHSEERSVDDLVELRSANEESQSEDLHKGEISESMELTRRSYVDKDASANDESFTGDDNSEKIAAKSDETIEKKGSSSEKTDSVIESSDKISDNDDIVDISEKIAESDESAVKSGQTLENSAASSEKIADVSLISDKVGSEEHNDENYKSNVERFAFSNSEESVPFEATRRMLNIPNLEVSQLGVLGQLGSRRSYSGDLIPPQQPHLSIHHNPISLFNLPAAYHKISPETYHTSRSYVPIPPENHDLGQIQSYNPYSNSYPFSPIDFATRQAHGAEPIFEQESHKPNPHGLHKIFDSNFSPIKHPLLIERQRRNAANQAPATPIIGFFKGLFDDFKMTYKK